MEFSETSLSKQNLYDLYSEITTFYFRILNISYLFSPNSTQNGIFSMLPRIHLLILKNINIFFILLIMTCILKKMISFTLFFRL